MSAPAILTTFGVDTARARRTDPSTSHEAADVNDVHTSIGAVLDCLREDGPMTDERIEVRLHELKYKFTGQRLRTARKALVEGGHVRFTGEKALTSRGNKSKIWEAVPRAAKRPEPVPEGRECQVCDITSVVEVDRYTLGLTKFEDWQCPDCRHWNTREVH
jgi:hypothetical protein